MIQEPCQCFTEFLPKVVVGIEAHFALYLCRIDGIAPVVSGPILNELYLRFVRRPTGAQFIHDGTQGLHHLQVGTLAVATDCMDAGARATQEQWPPML